MMASLKFENICRLCLKQDSPMSSIYENWDEKNQALLVGKITSIARVDINPKDGLPTSICQLCKSQVQQFYEFRLLVEISDRTLRQCLKVGEVDNDLKDIDINPQKIIITTKPHKTMTYSLLMPLPNGNLEVPDTIIIKTDNEDPEDKLKFSDPNNDEIINADNIENVDYENEIMSDKHCCELCSAQFNTLDDLKNHVIEHCLVTKRIVKKNNASKSKAVKKLIANQENNPRKSNQTNKIEACLVKCITCSESFTKASIKKHSIRCAWRQIELVCDVCGMTFNKKSELRYHKGAHLPSPLMCEMCNKQFRNVQSYNIHMKRHTIGSRFSCETCGQRYYTNSELARHVQKHAEKRKHPCHLCNTAFLSQPELNRHLKYHNGVKKFKCDICSKSYYESGHLKVHMRVHTGEKPFVCNCGKAFITKSKLIRHEKIHKKRLETR